MEAVRFPQFGHRSKTGWDWAIQFEPSLHQSAVLCDDSCKVISRYVHSLQRPRSETRLSRSKVLMILVILVLTCFCHGVLRFFVDWFDRHRNQDPSNEPEHVDIGHVGEAWTIIVLGNRTPRPRHLQGAMIKYTNTSFVVLIRACPVTSGTGITGIVVGNGGGPSLPHTHHEL
jgi:hypothetical protein